MKKLLGLLVVLALAVPGQALANEVDGDTLFEWAQEYEMLASGARGDGFHSGKYLGYVSGVYVALSHAGFVGKSPVPPDLDKSRVCALVLAWLKQHPERRHEPAVSIIVTAITEKPLQKLEG